tara:strand:+ start:18850 stop:19134 length:285 start_codon:yes stop_codon:yes gene_type:complete
LDKKGDVMADKIIKVDEHTPMLFKALIRYSPFKQNYFAEELGIKESNLSSYLSGKKVMPDNIRDGLLRLLDFEPECPYILITTDRNQLIRKGGY